MLKYYINAKKNATRLKEIELDDYEVLDIYTPDNSTSLLVCYLPDDKRYKLSDGMDVYVISKIDVDNDNGLTSTEHSFTLNTSIIKVNEEKGLFTLKVDRYYDLELSGITEVIYDDLTEWYINFTNEHFFLDRQNNMIYYDGNGDSSSGSDDLYGDILIYVEYTDTNGELVTIEIVCEYSSPTTLKVVYDEDTLGDLRESIYSETLDGLAVSSLRVYRENPYWKKNAELRVYTDFPVCSLRVPLSQGFETDMFVGYGIQEEFVDATRDESIGSIVEMEKDVYVPVIWDSDTDAVLSDGDETNGEVYEIQFNLHFRQHRGDDWLADDNMYWNGVINDNGTLRFIDAEDCNSQVTSGSNDNCTFFVMDDKSSQSDLLTYLGFTNNDVKYQKSKIKMSFLRLLFYDSTNQANQNLLHYSTIFMDTGKLFKKYIKGVEDTPYSLIMYDTDSDGNDMDTVDTENCSKGKVGIRVDREPCGNLLDECDDDDDIEELRLSSRFVVEDKYDSLKSSEGFYLYLWKDNDAGVAPTDLYMKVEFNHAGYGRTIPFMMPFYDEKAGDGKNGIKTFDEILDDWNDEETRYGIRKYTKYSYIHLKYRYDKVNGRHVYYLDDTFYGNGVHYSDNKLVFNLYEAKMV